MARAFRLSRGSATVVRLQTSYGERIKLIAPDGAPVPPLDHGEFVFDRLNVSYLTFIVADVNAALRRLREAGTVCMTGPVRIESRPGLYIAFLRDPQGNVVELVQYDDIAGYRADLS